MWGWLKNRDASNITHWDEQKTYFSEVKLPIWSIYLNLRDSKRFLGIGFWKNAEARSSDDNKPRFWTKNQATENEDALSHWFEMMVCHENWTEVMPWKLNGIEQIFMPWILNKKSTLYIPAFNGRQWYDVEVVIVGVL